MPIESDRDLSLVLDVIQEQGTLEMVRDALKDKGVPHSAGSWADMRSERLEAYAVEGTLSADDLVALMRAAEEYGHQHVFLYQCSPAEAGRLLDRGRVETMLRKDGLSDLLDRPRLVDQPESPAIVDVRWEPGGDNAQTLVIKYVSTRERRSLKAEEDHGSEIVQVWSVEKYRAVTVFRLHSSGLLELAVQSHRNSNRYEDDVDEAWGVVVELLGKGAFHGVDLGEMKNELLRSRRELAEEITSHYSKLRNLTGTSITAATGKQTDDQSLFDDPGASSGLEHFLEHNGYCDHQSFTFVSQEDSGALPTKSVRVIMPTKYNELGITAHASRSDHEHVLSRILQLT